MFQARIDPSKLGRVLSFYATMTMLVVPVGLLLAGPVAERTGAAPWFVISGAAIAVAACAVELAPSVRALRSVTPGEEHRDTAVAADAPVGDDAVGDADASGAAVRREEIGA